MSTSLSRPLSIEKPHSTTYRPDEGWSANDALYGLGTLLLCFLFTQSAWTLVIRPHAAAVLQQVVVVTSADKVQHAVHQLRSIFVILKDYEQQTAITLTLWSFLLVLRQGQAVRRSRDTGGATSTVWSMSSVVAVSVATSAPLDTGSSDEQDNVNAIDSAKTAQLGSERARVIGSGRGGSKLKCPDSVSASSGRGIDAGAV